MLLGGVDRAKAHPRRDLGARRRIARYLGQLAHQAQDLGLSSRQFFHTGPPYTESISSMGRLIKSGSYAVDTPTSAGGSFRLQGNHHHDYLRQTKLFDSRRERSSEK